MVRFTALFFGILHVIAAAPESPAELIHKSVQLQREGRLAEAATLMKDLLARPGLSAMAEGLALNELGLAQHSRNQYDEAERIYLRAVRTLEKAEGAPPIYLIRAHMNLASLYIEWGRFNEAEKHRTAVPMSALTEISDISQALGLIAALATGRGDLNRAQAANEENLAFLRRNSGPECEAQVATILNNIGSIELRREQWADAERWLALAVRSQRAASEVHPNLMKVLTNLAHAQLKQRKFGDAEASLQEALVISRTTMGESHSVTAMLLEQQAAVLQASGKKQDAKRVKREAAVMRQQLPPPLPRGTTIDVSAFQSFTKGADPDKTGNAKKQIKQ